MIRSIEYEEELRTTKESVCEEKNAFNEEVGKLNRKLSSDEETTLKRSSWEKSSEVLTMEQPNESPKTNEPESSSAVFLQSK